MIKKYLVIALFFCISTIASYAQSDEYHNNQALRNIETFTKLYGYVKYFHPGYEASQINWDHFAMYGIKKVEKCPTPIALKKILEELYHPIAPGILITDSANAQLLISNITPASKKDRMKVAAWQHLGMGRGSTLENNWLYRSERISGQLFSERPKIGEYISKDIGNGLFCVMPLALYRTIKVTYPQAPVEDFNQLITDISQNIPPDLNEGNLYVRLAGVIIAWNVFRHFYPYSEEVQINWQLLLQEAIVSAYADTSERDFKRTLRKLTAGLKDGHGSVRLEKKSGKMYLAPIAWEWVENQVVISEVYDESLSKLKKGDIVLAINGVNITDTLLNIEQYISSATFDYRRYRSLDNLLMGMKDAEVILKISRETEKTDTVKIIQNTSVSDYFEYENSKQVKVKKIKGGVYYLNLSQISMKEINNLMPQLIEAQSIICDLRGYPNSNHNLIAHLLSTPDTSTRWMNVPRIIYPEMENITYESHGWKIQPKEPRIRAKVVFIINSKAISYAESYLSFIEHYKLATIIGQPTAGTNGNINEFSLPGGYKVVFTGMKVVKHDGSQHHGVGIIPDIVVNKTIQGIKEGRDEFFEKALEILEIKENKR